jgi:glycosyltransferase involved in cell wall biosynthesis
MQQSLPLVTIAIPTYNRAGTYLPQTLTSALQQTYENIEVIVSDNCSTDHTSDYVTNTADPRIRYFRHEKNIGPAKNCDFCLVEAKGQYILILHDDDLIDHDFVDRCMRAIDYKDSVGIICTGTRVIDADGKTLRETQNLAGGLSTEAFFRAWYAGRVPLYLCSTMFHLEKLRAIGGLRSKRYLHDDAVAIVQLAAAHGRADVQEVKASFRRHIQRDAFSPTDIAHWCEDSLQVLDLMCEAVPQSRALLCKEGGRFFANRCYDRAAVVKSPLSRVRAYAVVLRKFHYRYFPPDTTDLMKASCLWLTRYVTTRLKRSA